jgi:hypothetical protein
MTLRVATVSAVALSIAGMPDPAVAQIIPKPTVTVTASQTSIAENPLQITRTTSTTSLSTSSTGGVTFTVRVDIAVPVDVSLPYSVSGTAVAGRDYRALSGSVLIRAGQTTGTITVTPIDDSEDEADETVTIAIVSTSSSPYSVGRPGSASTTIIDDDQVSIVGASFEPEAVLGGRSSDLRVTLSSAAPPGGLAIRVQSYDTNVVSDGQTTIPAGAREGLVTLTTTPQPSSGSTQVTVSEPNGSSVLAFLRVLTEPAVSRLNFSNPELYGGDNATTSIALDAPAPPGGLTVPVSVAVQSPGGAMSPVDAPSTITIAEGNSTARLRIPTRTVSTSTRVAMTVGSGTRSATATLTVHPAQVIESISVTPGAVGSGQPVDVTVRMVAPVPAVSTGWTVYLSGSGPVEIPSGLFTVAPGAAQATVRLQTTSVAVDAEATVGVSDSPGGTVLHQARFSVAPPTVTGLRFGTTESFGGQSYTGNVSLSAPAPATGLIVPIKVGVVGASAKSIPPVSAPKALTVPPGATSARLNLETTPVSNLTEVQVLAGGSMATITLHPAPRIESITATPDPVTGGGNIAVRVQLDRPNPIASRFYLVVAATGPIGQRTTPLLHATVSSTGNRAGAMTFGPGEREVSYQFETEPVAVASPAEIRLEDIFDPANSGVATLQVTPPSVTYFTFFAEAVFGGSPTGASVFLDADAPPGGLTVPITLTALAGGALPASAPASVTIPAGTRRGQFSIETQLVQTVTDVQVEVGGYAGTMAVHPTPRIESITATPDPATGSSTVTIRVRLDRPNPIASRVYMAVAATGPLGQRTTPLLRSTVSSTGNRVGAMTFEPGEREVSYQFETEPVAVATPAEIRLEDIFDPRNSGVLSFDVLPKPPVTFNALTIDPARLAGAAVAQAMLVVTEPAAFDVIVNLLSDRPQTATIPASVTIPTGATTATFRVVTSDVSASESVRITASNGSQQITQTLTVDPAPPTIQNLVPTPSDAIGGGEIELAVTLTKPAGPGGFTATLSSTDPSLVPPPTVQIPTSQQTATVRTRTAAVPAERFIRLGLPGTPAANIALRPIPLDRVQSPGSVRGGGVVTVEVRLIEAAPAGGLRVPLASSDAAIATLPAFVDIPAGSVSAGVSVQIGTVAADTQVTITAGIGPGAVSREFRVRS